MDKYQLKVSALKTFANELKSDIYLFQEIGDREAIELLIDTKKYDIYVTNDPIPLKLAIAVKKSISKEVTSKVISELAVKDNQDRSVRSGLELKIKLNDTELNILNVHLKSGCKNYIIDDPD